MKKSLLLSAALILGATGVFAEDAVLAPVSTSVWAETFGTSELKDGAVVVKCIEDGWSGGGITLDATSLEGYNQLVIEYQTNVTFQMFGQGGPGEKQYDNLTPTIQLPFWKTSQTFDLTGEGPIKQVCFQAIGQKFEATITKIYLRNYAPEYEEAEDIIAKFTAKDFSLSEFGASIGDEDYVELSGTCATQAGWGIGAIGADKTNLYNINSSDGTAFSVKITGAELKAQQAYAQSLSTEYYIWISFWGDGTALTSAKLYKLKNAEEGQTTTTPVVNINVDTDVVSTVYYTLTGAQVDEPQKGINIVKQTLTDGSTRVVKVLVK